MENMTVWGIITFGFDYQSKYVLEELCSSAKIAKARVKLPSSLKMDFPHRNMRGYLELGIGKPIIVEWGDIHVADENKLKRIEEMIGAYNERDKRNNTESSGLCGF